MTLGYQNRNKSYIGKLSLMLCSIPLLLYIVQFNAESTRGWFFYSDICIVTTTVCMSLAGISIYRFISKKNKISAIEVVSGIVAIGICFSILITNFLLYALTIIANLKAQGS